jgi:preprotein translocase subunit SecE
MASDQTMPAKSAKTTSAKGGAAKSTSDKPAKASTKVSKAAAPKPNVFERLMKYFRDVRTEMRRVVWPSREEVIQSSVVVVVALVFFIFYVLIWDTASEYIFITLPTMLFGGK